MAITSLPAQEFAQDVHEAFTATETGPVFITDRGIPSHVLISYPEYQRLLALKRSISSSLAMPGDSDVEFEAPRVDIYLRPADFL
ncbi:MULTISPECIES: type II toxin-antitoxin system Phd/YefM family antitoxin [unclassified Herbaspirillum]|uniref:type II toxin-antitoxin system Phd/YefM family antitoxin n=1 Tax=unclassified Herbaspirillum TaxID=2624150 RepID=UPI0011508AB5|nr:MULTISPECIES: type II toxin-antitoxin system Phd/YefM family antitoxin [unclassified Herbaspirillum]TQK01324.1 antitoxin Phd_YefM of type II toxin-antitoxin system [Herbaspirillum sp. SJZ130]TQK05720.1 antitoxin Phd_YefM of type II toxin-antitoxin system [Herbaspirillum sp. SJZ106]